jgi:predicted DNA-binding protein with PD1-like motif
MDGLEDIRTASGRLGRIIFARLAPGVDLLGAIESIVEREALRYAVILSGAASLRSARLRNVKIVPDQWPIKDGNRILVELAGPLELLSLSGNVSRRPDGAIHLHAHGVVSVGGGPQPAGCYGGHLVPGSVIFSTGEIALAELLGIALNRRLDDETKTLELYPEPPDGA